MVNVIAVAMVCVLQAGEEASPEGCLQMQDPAGPVSTMVECEARVRALTSDQKIMEAMAYILVKLRGHGGDVTIQGGCTKAGRFA